MIKSILCSFLLLFALAYPHFAFAKVLRCHGEYIWWNNEKNIIRLDIVLPDKLDLALTLSTIPKGEFAGLVSSSLSPAGKGMVEIKWGANLPPQQHDFIVTKLPGGGFSLYGFCMDGYSPLTIRVDLWKEGKPFYLFEPYRMSQLIQGQCEE